MLKQKIHPTDEQKEADIAQMTELRLADSMSELRAFYRVVVERTGNVAYADECYGASRKRAESPITVDTRSQHGPAFEELTPGFTLTEDTYDTNGRVCGQHSMTLHAVLSDDLIAYVCGGVIAYDTYGPTSPLPMLKTDWLNKCASPIFRREPAPRWWSDRYPEIEPALLSCYVLSDDTRKAVEQFQAVNR